MIFGERLKELRHKNKLSQESLAKKLHLSKQVISNYEKGRRLPNIEQIVEISNLFGVSTDYLLGKTESTNPEYSSVEEITGLGVLAISNIVMLRNYTLALNHLFGNIYFKELIVDLQSYLLDDMHVIEEGLEELIETSLHCERLQKLKDVSNHMKDFNYQDMQLYSALHIFQMIARGSVGKSDINV
jgi:transcriptional regulator with XRE-family HTH domain